MKNIMNKWFNNVKTEIKQRQTTNEIIDEIHESFYTEVDRLLADSKILKSTDTQLQELIDKSDKLKALGFINTKECKDANVEINRLFWIKKDNESKQDLNEAINYFTTKYPLNKFITEESVVKICNKYGLVYGTIDRYLGTVPDKNFKEIKNHTIQSEDWVYYQEKSLYDDTPVRGGKNLIDKLEYEKKEILSRFDSSYFYTRKYSSTLEIAAPLKDFDMKGYELNGVKLSKIEIPDPVVLHPVQFKNKKYYLILSAWGQESTDELVLNNINN